MAVSIACAGLLALACKQEAVAPVVVEERSPVESRVSVDRAVATTGDVITYSVEIEHEPGYEVDVQEPGAEIAGFRILDLGRDQPEVRAGRVIDRRWYRLRADLVGSYVLPPVTVHYRPVAETGDESATAEPTPESAQGASLPARADAPEQTLETSEIFVEVESVLPADGEVTDIRDIKPLRVIAQERRWAGWVAAAIAVALAVAGWLFWRRRRGFVEQPPRPAHEIAFEALGRLRRADFDDPVAVHAYYFAISEVLRTYVEGRFGLNATDLTTEEILSRFDLLPELEPANEDRLRSFLVDTDQVKFADHRPTPEEIETTYENALSFVELTRPTVPEEGDEAGEGQQPPPTTSADTVAACAGTASVGVGA